MFPYIMVMHKMFWFYYSDFENKEQKDYLKLSNWDHKGGEIQKQEIRNFQYTIYVQFFSTILRYETLNS